MSTEPVLVEVIGGPKVVLDLNPADLVEQIADAAAAAVERSLVEEDGTAKAWRLFAPTGKGGFAPAKPDATLDKIASSMRGRKESGGKTGFGGPGEHEGKEYLFRIRLFVPSLPPPKPVEDKTPIEDEEAIDLTDIDAIDHELETVRRVAAPDPPKRRRRKTGDGPRTGRHKAVTTGKHGTVGTDTGRRRRRQSGEIPAGARKSGRMRKRASGEMPRQRRKSGEIPARARKSGSTRARRKKVDESEEAATVREVPGSETAPGVTPTADPGPPELEKPAEEATVEARPAEEKPAEEKPAEEKPAEERAVEEAPAAEAAPAEEAKPAEAKAADSAPIEPPAKEKPEEADEEQLEDSGEPTTVMTREALDKIADATLSPRREPIPTAPPADPAEVSGEVKKTRVVTRALEAPTPARGTKPVTGRKSTQTLGGQRKTGNLKAGRTTGAARSTGTMRRTGAPDGARRTSHGKGKKSKNKGSSGLVGLLVALMLFAIVTVAFVVVLTDKGPPDPPDNTDAPTSAPTTAARLSDRQSVAPWPHSPSEQVDEIVGRLNRVVASGSPGDPDRLGAVEVIAKELGPLCGDSFQACEAASAAAFSAYHGCRRSSDCGPDAARAWFLLSVQHADAALAAVKVLDGAAQSDGVKRVTVQSVRLAGQSMKGLRGVSPQLATLAEQACQGSLGSTPDCVDALKE